jgi:hypothetical protein
MSKTAKAMTSYHRAATLTVACPVCHAPRGKHCPSRRKAPERETHRARVVLWERLIAQQKEQGNG